MKLAKLDCPLCGVFMRSIIGQRYTCPICNSVFTPYQPPVLITLSKSQKQKARWVQDKLKERSK
jgi:transposase-like protein